MKKLLSINIIAAAVLALGACHKVAVTPNSLYTEDVFPTNDAQFQSVSGPLYTSLRGHWPLTYFFVSECTTDEAILPAYGGNWYDGNGYGQLHRHDWTKDLGWIGTAWNDASNMIGLSNQTLYIFKKAPESAAKNTALAEVRTMRAFAFWEMMDMFGGVPLDTFYPSPGLQPKTPRAQVFSFIESEIKECIPYLKSDVSTGTYGKPTKWMAFSLLAKMYLNAQVYTGTAKNNECIAACDSVISSGKFAIEPRTSYLQMFYPNNGPSMKEFIFAIPYDPAVSSGYMFYARYDLNRNLGVKYRYFLCSPGNYSYDQILLGVTKDNGFSNANRPSGPRATLPSYLNTYFLKADANDIRNNQWLYGPQYWPDGSRIMINTSNKGYDETYSGTKGSDTFSYHLNIDTNILLRRNPATLDLGNDEIAWNSGARNIKFLADPNSITRNQSNDVPIFRYSDIILMKAEAILRGGNATGGHTALGLVNMVRNQRSTSAAWTSVSLENLYAERCREFTWENWHRNDMIRFGKYENSYGFKTNADVYRRVFPIPTGAMQTNSKLVQNDGY
jgi:starch-binding outer membrane protein, SusD/RagB family